MVAGVAIVVLFGLSVALPLGIVLPAFRTFACKQDRHGKDNTSYCLRIDKRTIESR